MVESCRVATASLEVRGAVEVDDTDGDGDVLLSLEPTTQWWIIGTA
jgi:hypothetical protein